MRPAGLPACRVSLPDLRAGIREFSGMGALVPGAAALHHNARMLKQEVARGPAGRVLVMNSITQVEPEDAGCLVVSSSHGGTSSGEFALAVPLALAVFNDAGVGKDEAGIAALSMLQARGVPAATVAHTSARIGDSMDSWQSGIVSHANAAALARGIAPGMPLRAAIDRWIGGGGQS